MRPGSVNYPGTGEWPGPWPLAPARGATTFNAQGHPTCSGTPCGCQDHSQALVRGGIRLDRPLPVCYTSNRIITWEGLVTNTFQLRRFARQTQPLQECHPEQSEMLSSLKCSGPCDLAKPWDDTMKRLIANG